MLRAPALIALSALSALMVCGSSAFAQNAASPTGQPPPTAQPPAGQPAPNVAGTSDEDLTKAITASLNADPHHFFRHVNVRVDNGVATLSGFVHSSSSIFRARTLAQNVTGVTRVVTSNLTLEPNRPR